MHYTFCHVEELRLLAAGVKRRSGTRDCLTWFPNVDFL
jgi:hypothetical protein